MNSFYNQHKYTQWTVALLMVAAIIWLSCIWMDLMNINLIFTLLIFILVPLFQFFSTPLFTLLGTYSYLTPMLLVFGASDKKYDLHNGTSFDYLMVMRGIKPGLVFRNKMLLYYINGILLIIEKIESGILSTAIEIRGSSYFFSEQTAKRLGFEIQGTTSSAEKINLYLNYLDLTWMLSLVKGKFTLPNLSNIKTASTTGDRLIENKAKLIELKNFLNRAS